MRRPRVDILYFEDCPNHSAARALVERIAGELQVVPEIRLIEVGDPDAAVGLRFLGSPTIRVDGRDVEPGADRRDDFTYGCRVYRGPRGLSGGPDEAWIREALEQAS
ncbi:MAG: DF family (seleno)protein [Gaiellaceae bacterium]